MRTLAYFLSLALLCTASCGDGGGGAGDAGGGGGSNQCPSYDLAFSPGADLGAPGPCGGQTCAQGQVCRFSSCVPAPTACTNDSQCQGDSYCQDSECIPYGVGPRGASNAQCKRAATMGVFSPKIKCRWSGPAAGDPFPNHRTVLSSPVVADFDLDKDPRTVKPSIVFTSGNCAKSCQSEGGGCYGVIRVIDGDTCQPQFSMEAPAGARVIEQTPPSVADLNGDRRPEIVVQNQAGGITAFTFDPALNSGKGDFKQLFHNGAAVNPTDCTWAALSIHDLTNDGVPEIIQASPNPTVYDNTGKLIDKSAVNTDGLPGTSQLQPVLADIDGDGRVELLTGKEVLRFNPMTSKWETVNSNGPRQGFTGLADFGTYTANGNDRSKLDGIPEIVVVTVDGRVRILRADGTIIFDVAHPGTQGGSPTIADYDRDGRVEIGVAGTTRYTVFDPDCIAGATAATCPSGRTDRTLWSQATQDPSGFTGSTVFDFDGDGRPKVVYSDECFVRIYDGASGEVLASLPSRSQTYYEAPVVADTNGDLQADIVVAQNSEQGCPAVDPTFAGPRCQTTSDCPGTSQCAKANANDAYGRCSCTTDAQCRTPDQPFLSCQPALSGAGRFCRTARDAAQTSPGVLVIADTRGRWVPTRPLWNQFVYTVTNVNDDTSIPKTSEWRANWRQPELNNFLQNVQGQLNLQGAPDLTVRPEALRACANNKLTLSAQVCNRGTLATGVPVPVVFSDGMTTLCSVNTSGNLAVGACQRVSCEATLPQSPRDLALQVQAGGVNECEAGNNRATLAQAGCFQCTAADAGACDAAGQICDLAQRRCAACQSDGQCGGGWVCRAGRCQAAPPECSATDASACVAKGLICAAQSGRCAFCTADSQCPSGQVCNQSCGGVCQVPGVRNPRFVGGCSAGGAGGGAGAAAGFGATLVLAALQRRRLRRRRGLGAAALLALLGAATLAPQSAHAQDNTPRVNAQTFKPVLMPEGLITVEGSRTPQALRPILGFLLEYAYRPLRLVDGDNNLVANTIPRMLTAHLYAGFGITRWLAVAAALPVVAYEDYDNRTPRTLIPVPPSSSGLGDLRLMAKLRILNNEEGGFGLAFAPQVTFPTGGSFRSDDAYGIEPRFAADWRTRGGLIIAANLGFLARTSDQELLNAKISHQVRYGGGVYVPLGLGFGLAGEISGGTSVKKGQSLYSQLEAYAAARWVGKSGVNFNIGGGAAVIETVGSPQFRVFAGLGYLPFGNAAPPPPPPSDRDGDGIVDTADQCPDQAEDRDGFQDQDGCPDPDNDGDGVLDADDRCPLVAGPKENQGCPDQDKDGDGIIDRLDKCPEQAGPAETQGCPDPDKDGDGIVDRLDKCPDQAGPKENQGCPDTDQDSDGVVDRNDLCPTEKGPAPTGCPKKKFIEVTQEKINLREQVRFDTNKAVIKPGSYPMLDEVVKVLKGRTDLLLRIEGHTDNTGKLERNMELSEQRAAAVRDYLIKGGVDAGRMVSKGYGPTRPIADNATKDGREKNRRTEFFLVSKEEFEAAKAGK